MPTYHHKACQFLNLAYQHAKERANFFKHYSYEMQREMSILYYCIKNSTLYLISYFFIRAYVSHIKIVLYFISVLHAILKKNVWNFCFLKLFCSLVRNGNNMKRPGFYTLQVTFPLKKLKQNKEYVWILWSSWIVICLNWRFETVIKKPYRDCFFPFLTIMFSSTEAATGTVL